MSKPAGRRKPPVGTRFRKGQSGNPKGRPKAQRSNATGSAFDIVIDRMLTVTQGGIPREVTVEEALQHRTYQDAIAGSRLAQREVLKMIEKRERYLAARAGKKRFPPVERRIEPTTLRTPTRRCVILGIATRGARDGSAAARALGGAGGVAAPPGRQTAYRRRRLAISNAAPAMPARCDGHEAPANDRCARESSPPSATAGHRPQAASARAERQPARAPAPASTKQPPYEAVLGQRVTIREDGVERRVSAAEAFLLHMTKKGLEGDSAAARATMAAIADARAARLVREPDEALVIIRVIIRPGSVNGALEPLRMGRKLDRYRETARMMLEPWIVEAALARLGSRRLTARRAAEVFAATRTPAKVRWPDWWAGRAMRRCAAQPRAQRLR